MITEDTVSERLHSVESAAGFLGGISLGIQAFDKMILNLTNSLPGLKIETWGTHFGASSHCQRPRGNKETGKRWQKDQHGFTTWITPFVADPEVKTGVTISKEFSGPTVNG